MNNCSIERNISNNTYELLHFIIETVNQSVTLYFIVFFGLFYKCVSVIEFSVARYFIIFQNIFLACLQEPQIYFMTLMVFLVLLTFYMILRMIINFQKSN